LINWESWSAFLEAAKNPLVVVRLLEPPLFVVSIFLLIWASLPQADPFKSTFRPFFRIFTRWRYFVYVMIGLSVIVADVVLTAIDHRFTDAVLASRGEDFTSLIWQFEGSGAAIFQRWMWMPLTWYMAWAYVIAFPALVPWTMAVFDWLGETRRNISVLIAYVMNYLLVLPFYTFFPVRESHVFYKADLNSQLIRLGLDDCHPAIMTILRPMSGIDNCFPSFHTSLSVTMALFAWRSGRKAFALTMGIVSVSIILSTLYLGIHWLFDVAGGILLGCTAYWIGEWGSKRFMRWSARRRQTREYPPPQSLRS
jgi:membrane-associated phospholipid phosphatase